MTARQPRDYDGREFDGREFDLVIVGGGLVGASLAVALAPAGLSLAVVEPVAVDCDGQPSFDERTVALTWNARRIYTGIGVWQEIAAKQAEPIREIHISNRGHFGMTHLGCAEVGVEALGYVVPTRVLGRVLHSRMKQSDAISLLCPATATQLRRGGRTNEVSVLQNGESVTLRARLVVLADGGRSRLAEQVGIQSDTTPPGTTQYPQSAIISLVRTDRAHHGRAFERFTDEGPLALLPHSDKRYALIWTTAAQRLRARMALPDAGFIEALQRAFGDRAGNFSEPGARKCYPLHHGRVANPVGQRTLTIGNAAHTIHPVAGQGFNLGLRDVAVLAELLYEAAARREDIGDAAVLEKYAALRRRETAMVSGFTDGLIKVFCSRRKPVGLARNLALAGIELCPPLKGALLRRTMGMAGTPSRPGFGLSLGLPLGLPLDGNADADSRPVGGDG